MEVENSGISQSDTQIKDDVDAAVRNAVASLVETEGIISSGTANVKVDSGGMIDMTGRSLSPDGQDSVVVVSADETAVSMTQVQMTGTGIEKLGGKIIEDSSVVVPMVEQQEGIQNINIQSQNDRNKDDNGQRSGSVAGGQQNPDQASVQDVDTGASDTGSMTTEGNVEMEIMELSSSTAAGMGQQQKSADEQTTGVSASASHATEESDTNGAWNKNNCIVCNVGMESVDAADPNQVEGNKKLKKFFLEYLGVNETAELTQSDDTFPFCAACADDLDKLMALACKIEFMDLQFEKLRDTLARKTVKTYLCRTRPEMLNEDAEQIVDITDEPLDTNAPKPLLNPADVLFNQWKRQYDLIIPGRYKKFPTLMKTVDPKQRISYYRIDSSGRHHFIATVNPDQPSDMPSAVSPNSQGLKRKVATILKINGDTLGIKRLKPHSEDQTDESEEEMEQQMEMDSTEEDRQFKCALCPKSFSSRSILNYHARVHSGERPFKCNLCDKTFAQRGGLATHALVHSGEKPYHCEECGKSFRQKYHLTQHQLIHTGVKPFSCDICHKSFNVKMNLREHMRRHTGERPYRCAYCTCQGFFRKKMLRDHIVKSHPERQLPMDLESLGPTPKFPKARMASSKVHEDIQNILDSPKLAAKFINRRVPLMKTENEEVQGLISVNTSSGSVPQLGNILAEDSQALSEEAEELGEGTSTVQTFDLVDKKLLPHSEESQVEAHFGPNEPILEESSSSGREKSSGSSQATLLSDNVAVTLESI